MQSQLEIELMERFDNRKREIGAARSGVGAGDAAAGELQLHPAWQALIRYCREFGHGELERIKIQDGLPVSIEVVTRKIRLC